MPIGRVVEPYRKPRRMKSNLEPFTPEIQQLIRDVQEQYEYSAENLGDTLGVSTKTVRWWQAGKVEGIDKKMVATMRKMLRGKKMWAKAHGSRNR
jgi:DNA-binding transcriptional regulator YiaG